MSTSMPFESREDFFKMLRSHVPKNYLETLEADPDEKKIPASVAAIFKANEASLAGFASMPATNGYGCVTQKNQDMSDPLAIWIGYGGEIPRWKKGSTVNWAVMKNGFPSAEAASVAAYSLNRATKEWNSHNIGMSFKWVTKLDDAAFVLKFSENGIGTERTLARAFFPNTDPLSDVIVYKLSFEPGNVGYMVNIFLHELGHVIGLRHEFAAQEGGAVPMGVPNEHSVMGYKFFPPRIQESDVTSTKQFYDYTDASWKGLRMSDKIPDN